MINTGMKLSFEEVLALSDNTELYIETVFPSEHSFIGIKKGNHILDHEGKIQWALSDDFKALCCAWIHNKQTIKIYKMDDCEYWISDLSEEETAKIYCEEYGLVLGKDIDVEEIEECDLDNDGMYWNFESKEIDLLIKALLKDKSSRTLFVDGNKLDIAMRDGTCIWIPFRRAIELDEPYIKPHMIACTEC